MRLRITIFTVTAALVGTYAHGGTVNDTTQENAQLRAAHTNYVGSDNSMEAATNRAMIAIMNLASLNIPGAFANGYKAYGHYINSEKMDELEARALKLQGSMASLAKAAKKGATDKASGLSSGQSSGVSGTTFSRLKTDFLYKGEMAEVANEFEKRTGMKREEFLQHLSSATDAKLRWDDPELMQKLESRFQAFTARIPNKEFREGLETASNMFPSVARAKTIQEIASFYFDAWGNQPKELEIAQSSEPTQSGDGVIAVEKGYEAFTGKSTSREPAQLSKAPSQPNAPSDMGLYIGIKGDQETLNDLFQGSNSGGDPENLFKRISRRYRQLTPLLSAKGRMIESR